MAASRGVDLSRVRWLVLIAASAMVGALVAVVGPIGFVGLIVPHVLRRWLGHDHLVLLPACALGGGAFLALCDLVGRLRDRAVGAAGGGGDGAVGGAVLSLVVADAAVEGVL